MLSSKIPAFVAILCLFAPTTFGKQNASSVQPGIGLPPGIELPKTGMVYALAKKSSETTLIQIHASEVSSNLHTGSNLARSQFFMNLHATAELPGLKASLSIWTLSLCF